MTKAEYDSQYHKARRDLRRSNEDCVQCGKEAVEGHAYCKKHGSVRVLNQRNRLGQKPRSISRGGRSSVYLSPLWM